MAVVTSSDDVFEMTEHAARRTRMIAIVPLSEFADSPPNVFECRRRADRFNVRGTFELTDPESVNLCIDAPWGKYFPQNRGRVLRVDSIEQLERLSQILLSRPLMFIVVITYPWQHQNVMGSMMREFMVAVNPYHPVIRQQFEDALKKAMKDAKGRRNFALELDFNRAIEKGLKGYLGKDDEVPGFRPNFKCEFGRIVITNTSEFDHLYACHDMVDVWTWIFCLPCCMVACPYYRMKRVITCKDRRATIKSNMGYWRMTPLTHQTPEQAIKEFISSLHQLEGALGTVNLELACLRQIEPVPIRVSVTPSGEVVREEPEVTEDAIELPSSFDEPNRTTTTSDTSPLIEADNSDILQRYEDVV